MANFVKEKVAIVTGASAGIGEAIAYEFARQGSHLMLCGRDQGRLEKVQRQCQVEGGSGVKVKTVVGDLNSEGCQKKIIEACVKEWGRLDILVNNAGVLLPGNPENTTREDYAKMMDTNMKSLFFLTQLAIPHLKKTKGNVVNISSVATAFGVPGLTVYAMTKAVLDYYTKSLSLYLAPHGVRVNAVNPATVRSLIYRRGQNEKVMDDAEYEEFLRKQAANHPMGREVYASEVADAVLFLASDRASYITGMIVYVDGGRQNQGTQPKL